MADLVIVESPAKAKTISRFLGKGFAVRASMGHIRDLPKSKMGIDTEHEFEPTYIVPVEKKALIKELKGYAKSAKRIWLATDEDREGEAIGWHLVHALDLDEKEVKRIVFHEITEGAIKNALKNPRSLDLNLVDAQQARRVLDRLVGYELSPLLWKKIRYGLSAGRVQSVAVRLIVEREREIQAFKIEEYWTVKALFETKNGEKFEALLIKINGKNADLKIEKDALEIIQKFESEKYIVSQVVKKEAKRNPPPPFITSTLQQEASRKLGFSVKKTMMIAQQLYEGVEALGQTSGLITYMRTDSTNLAVSALSQAQGVIREMFGADFALKDGRSYKSRKGAQEAHEAIRPVDPSLAPDKLKNELTRDLHRLYDLIWKRFIACQMPEAILSQVSADVVPAGQQETIFRATGQSVIFPGFMKVYIEGTDDEESAEGESRSDQPGEKFLPSLKEKESAFLDKFLPEQHFTKPPPRYTEASLVKKLEFEGIGRPSTYAPTISTILVRGYVEKEVKALKPTDLGMVVTDLLVDHFPAIVDYQFTAEMEQNLDSVAEGEKKWVPLIRDFYQPFHKLVIEKDQTLKKSDITSEATGEKCEECGSPMMIKLGRYGKFYACSNYPKCKVARPMEQKEKTEEEKEFEKKFAGKKCEKCEGSMVVKNGRYGLFLGCSNYPKCRNIQGIVKMTGVKCPKCRNGQLIERRVRKSGKVFYGCNQYPKCQNALWDKPTGEICEVCQGLIVEKISKDGTVKKVCSACKKRVGGGGSEVSDGE